MKMLVRFDKPIQFTEVSSVTNFVQKMTEYDNAEIDVISGRFIIDAKSLMGLYSLDLSKEIEIQVHTEDINIANEIFNYIRENF